MQAGTGSAGRGGVAQAIDELDLGALGRAIWRRKRLIIGLTLLAAAIAFAAVNFVTPRYKSEARVLIETRDNIFLRPEAERTGERSATVDQEAVTSQVQLILSRGLALDVIRKLKLGEKPEFDPVLRGPSVIRTVLGMLGLVKDPMSQTPEERVLKSYMDRLVAFQVDKSRVIAIEFESQDPELAAQVVNAIADSYLVLQQTARQEQTREAADFFAGEIEKLRQSVADAEAKVEQYRSTTNLMIGTNNTTLSSQQLGDINAQVASARAQKSDAESKARIIRDALKRGAATEILRRHELGAVAPPVRAAGDTAGATRGAVVHAARPASADQGVAGADRRSFDGRCAPRPNVSRSPSRTTPNACGRPAAIAHRDARPAQEAGRRRRTSRTSSCARSSARRRSQRDLLESYLAKYREATARDNIGASSPEARIISRGIVSNTPSWPKKVPTVLIASLGMFTLAVGFILTGQLMSGPLPAALRRPRGNAALAAACRAGPATPATAPVAARRIEPAPRAAKPPTPSAPVTAAGCRTVVRRQFAGREIARALDRAERPSPQHRRRPSIRRGLPPIVRTDGPRRRRQPTRPFARPSRASPRMPARLRRPPAFRSMRSRGLPPRSERRATPAGASRWSGRGATWERRWRRSRWRARWPSRGGRCSSIWRWSRPTCR